MHQKWKNVHAKIFTVFNPKEIKQGILFGGEEWSYYLQAEVCAVFSKSIFSLLLGEKKQREIINLIRKKKRTNTTVITGLNFQTLHTYIRTHSTVFH